MKILKFLVTVIMFLISLPLLLIGIIGFLMLTTSIKFFDYDG